MEGRREMFRCGSCGKSFSYWVQTVTEHPKVKCYFCGVELFPKGEPPAVPAAAPSAQEPKPN